MVQRSRALTFLARPQEEFVVARAVFLRGLGACFLCAFVSLFVQWDGLGGDAGILPVGELMDSMAPWREVTPGFWHEMPTLFWCNASVPFQHALLAAGVALSLGLMAGVASWWCVLLLWGNYLSFVSLGAAGFPFLGFQWDALLLETALLSLFLVSPRTLWGSGRRAPTRGALWLLWFLLFRLMVASAVVKWVGEYPDQEDGNVWRALTALEFHYWTQPLPTLPAWYAAQAPAWFQRASVLVMLGIEFAVPVGLFLGRWARRTAAVLLALLQVVILVTGNYGFFNLLTLCLCALALDDGVWRKLRLRPRRIPARAPAAGDGAASRWRVAAGVLHQAGVASLLVLALARLDRDLIEPRRSLPGIDRARELGARWASLNGYGLFAHMTTERPELVVEGSDDGVTWTAYPFRYKPGDVARAPVWVQPHMPRLDWQMWFEALRARAGPSIWFRRFLEALLRGRPDVLALLDHNPFPDHPPRLLRVALEFYEFADADEHRATGAWWHRRRDRVLLGPISLP